MLAMVVLLVVVAVVVAAAAAVISSPLLAVAVVVAVVLVLVVMLVLLVLVLLLVLTLADVATKPAERPPLPVVLFRHSPVAPVVALKQLHCCKIAMLNLIADTAGTPVCVSVCFCLFLVSVRLRACIRRCAKATRGLHLYATLQRTIYATPQQYIARMTSCTRLT